MRRSVPFPAGLLLATTALAVYKAAALASEMNGPGGLFWQLLALDLTFLALLALAAAAICRVAAAWLRRLAWAMLALAVAFYLVHTFVLLALDEPMSLFDLARYLPETAVVGTFLDPMTLAAILAFGGMAWFRVHLGRRAVGRVGWLALLLLICGLAAEARAPPPLARYGVVRLGDYAVAVRERPGAIRYSREEAGFYAAAAAPPAEFFRPEPNLVLLIVESLSSANSKRVSGLRDLLGGFDRLAGRGVLFSNFFANHAASEGGIISLLSGFPPLHYPTATPLMFDEFAMQPSVVGEYRRGGYRAEFLTNAELGFIGLDRYLEGLGLDAALGRDEVPAMRDAPRFALDAPSDRLLYDAAMERVESLQAARQPWLLVLATVTTHQPYRHPEGGADEAAEVWRWALAQMTDFVESLERSGFFEEGILLITGDHRHMRPLTGEETARYGDSAKARIPLLAMGRGLPEGVTDTRFFQQSDLLRLLPRIAEPGRPLSPHPVWVERYNRIYGKVDSINRFSVFDESDGGIRGYPVRVAGAALHWTGQRPKFARVVESLVHAQRSAHQFGRDPGGPGCTAAAKSWAYGPSARQGLTVARTAGGGINGPAGPEGAAQVGSLAQGGSPGGSGTALVYRGFLEVERQGIYWFRTPASHRACLSIAGQLVVDQAGAGSGTQGPVELEPGVHPLEFRVVTGEQGGLPSLQWVTPELTRWRWREVPDGQYRLPNRADAQQKG